MDRTGNRIACGLRWIARAQSGRDHASGWHGGPIVWRCGQELRPATSEYARRDGSSIPDVDVRRSGHTEDDVTVPNALRAVKRGLISATTNMSMGGVRQPEEILEDDIDGS